MIENHKKYTALKASLSFSFNRVKQYAWVLRKPNLTQQKLFDSSFAYAKVIFHKLKKSIYLIG